ncbi:MAG: VOC family protein [Deltaproteobacteria bacterium]|nr:VOC family protein [Deltaproteobacteria bacterium]
MSLVMDHVIILVDDLEAASADFEALGFTVTPGGEHGEGLSHNALIHFADGTFFELLAFKRGWRASVLRSLYRAGALGFVARSRRRGGMFRFIEQPPMRPSRRTSPLPIRWLPAACGRTGRRCAGTSSAF